MIKIECEKSPAELMFGGEIFQLLNAFQNLEQKYGFRISSDEDFQAYILLKLKKVQYREIEEI